jgi:hypothetical protein
VARSSRTGPARSQRPAAPGAGARSRARLQDGDPGTDLGYRRQHQHPLSRPLPDQPGEDLVAGHAGQHQVEHDEVELPGEGGGEPLRSGDGALGHVAVVFQRAGTRRPNGRGGTEANGQSKLLPPVDTKCRDTDTTRIDDLPGGDPPAALRDR